MISDVIPLAPSITQRAKSVDFTWMPDTDFPVRMVYTRESGHTLTVYGAGENRWWSGSDPNQDDAYHAERLGITQREHRLQHELAHHLVGFAYYWNSHGSPIIWRDAIHEVQPTRDAELEEWMVTALQYLSCGRDVQDYGAILDLSKKAPVQELARILNWCMEAVRL